MIFENQQLIVLIALGIIGLTIAMMFLMLWSQKNRREYQFKLEQLKLDEKHREEEQQNRDMERYAQEDRQKREEEVELSKIAGGGTGGYIFIDLPDDKKSLFHDLLKGFEDYARLKGYHISFSIDSTFTDKLAFKFTLKNNTIDIATEKVRHDFKEYVEKVRSGESLDEMPIIVSIEEHELLFTALKNRINFLQHSYNLAKNTALYYENLISKFGSMPLLPSQNIILQTGGNMDSRNYKAINSNKLIQGDSNVYHDSSIDASINIGNSFNERKEQIEELIKLINAIQPDSVNIEKKNLIIKDLQKVKDELEDEGEPDKSRIKKWLERAKGLLSIATLSNDIATLVKKVYGIFGV